ncbi:MULTISPECIES: RING finger domain-containing protein [unclassified Endozoicomonas]|uniref:RING finger domain-containing protein n=1 Tax=unclassified Endozoicomonas TaxID=2644528 RepID=UPI003BB61C54
MHFYRLFTAFVLSLLAMAVVPLCYCLTIIDRHNPNDRVRIEINEGTDSQGVSQWQLSLLLPKGFNDRKSILCFKAPVVPADSSSIALLVTTDLSDYCYQIVIVTGEQTRVFHGISKRASESGTRVRLKSTTANRPELTSVTSNQPVKPHTAPLTLLIYSDNITESVLETRQTRNNTLAMTGDKLAGNTDFSAGGDEGFSYSPPPPWGGDGRPSGLFDIDLVILKPVINWLMSMGKDSSSFEEQPSPARLKMTRINADGSSSDAVITLGWLDFLDIEQLTDVNFWNTLFQRAATSCPDSESLQWQLGCLKRFLEYTALKTDHAGGLKAGNGDGKPSGKASDKASKEENNDHQKEKKGEPEDQQNNSPGESNHGSEEGNNRKDDNGKESARNARIQDLQVIANQLVALIESDDPDAVFKLRQILDELDMPQRLQVIETKSTNTSGNTATPLEAILKLQRSFYENSTRNRFIEQLIEATSVQTRTLDTVNILSERQPMIPPDRSMPEAGDNNLMILYKIVQDIINRFNQSVQQPSLGHFEKSCLTEYFVQLLLLYSNPLESIRELLEKISDSVIRRDIMIFAQSFTFSIPFRETLIQLEQHPSFHELERLSNELMRQAPASRILQEPPLLVSSVEPVISNHDNTNGRATNNSNRFAHYTQQVNSYRSDSGSTGSSPVVLPADRYIQQGARPKLSDPGDQQNPSSQKRFQTGPSHGNHLTNGAHNRSDLEASGINQNFSTKHSTDDSLLVELKGRAQEKKEKKRQQTKELTEQAQELPIEKQSLTAEVQALKTVIQELTKLKTMIQELTKETQGLRLENQVLVAMNENLITKNQELYKSMDKSNTEALHLKEQIKKLHVDLRRQQELVDHLIHRSDYQTASANQRVQTNNLAMNSNGTVFLAPFHPLNTYNEKASPPKEQLKTSAQEQRKPLCKDYRRLCYVKFECCQWYFPCHKCHNKSDRCEVTSRKALHTTLLLCSVCGFNGDITEDSQTCPGCNELMSEYFCAQCKHFTDLEKKPYHCDKCGICRTSKDNAFHCDVCNVCMNTRLQDSHKCRENSSHDECCICLEDTFSGGRIMPCSHKVHRECGAAMFINGIRTCPICRHPLDAWFDETIIKPSD